MQLAPTLKVKSGNLVRVEAPAAWTGHGFHEDLDVAMRAALLDMLSMPTDFTGGASRDDACSLMSVAADFCLTQVIDGKQGIHVPESDLSVQQDQEAVTTGA